MGVPGADVRYVLESLRGIEDAICSCGDWTSGHTDMLCSSRGAECRRFSAAGYCTRPLELLRKLKEELEAIQ